MKMKKRKKFGLWIFLEIVVLAGMLLLWRSWEQSLGRLSHADNLWIQSATWSVETQEICLEITNRNAMAVYHPQRIMLSENASTEGHLFSLEADSFYEELNQKGTQNYNGDICIPPGGTVIFHYPMTERQVAELQNRTLYIYLFRSGGEPQFVPLLIG